MGIRAVTLDFHGTIVTPDPHPGAIYAELAAAHGITVAVETMRAHFVPCFHRVRSSWPVPYGRDEDDARAFWTAVVQDCFTAATGQPVSEDLAAAVFTAFGEARRWRVLPGVVASLAELRRRAIPAAIASNFDLRIRPVIAELGLGPFVLVLPSTLRGRPKPDPDMLMAIADHLGVTPQEILHIGDNRREDGGAAAAAGTAFLAVEPHGGLAPEALIAALDAGSPA